MNSMMKTVFDTFVLLVGRFPFWVLAAACFTQERVTLGAFIAFLFAAALARGFLYAHEHDKGCLFSTVYSLWRNIAFPLLLTIFAGTVYFSLLYMLLAGTRTDAIIILMASAFFIISYVLGLFIKKPPRPAKNTILKRGVFLRAAITVLWLYFVLRPDGAALAACAFVFIYALEYLSTYETLNIRKHAL